ncbi:Nitroreductase [Seminavis robusta]|uniref:Nitroreductase n=1 Tax=Seminavis robusta TaxID=568900 RepID=A0A9N8EHH3_9STRA|nr:Nitroreductase [Seminavis robusta]|eukprot:Sro1197_g251580.1 Nitroreductase (235) ;mRNA; f:30028-30732
MMLRFGHPSPCVLSLLLLGLLFPCSRQQHHVDAFSSPSPSSQIHELLLSRRTINSFEAELPSYWEMKLTAAVEAATFAPNHKLTEPWRFHLLGNEAIQRVCELNAELVSSSKGPAAGAKKLERWLAMPGWLVVTQLVSDDNDNDNSYDNPMSMAREDYAACCCAVQNLSLSLHANGMGTKWTTGPVNFDPRFAEAVGLPENERVVGTIWFGKPVSVPSAPRKKLSLDNVLIKHA